MRELLGVVVDKDGTHAIKYGFREVSGLTAEQAVDLKRMFEASFSDGRKQAFDEAEDSIRAAERRG